ncbi:MAG: hypothetical protein JXA60_02315 [Candidatus Coatesbacteria bacterium]|nr:hypothetical protein [Candidatus Coatesbacteria bacterium]
MNEHYSNNEEAYIEKLSTNLGKLKLKTPWIMASGTFGYGYELKEVTDYRFIGAITTKTITRKTKAGNLPPRLFQINKGLLNTIGLANAGMEDFKDGIFPLLKDIEPRLILSIGGESVDEYLEVIENLEGLKKVSAIELNVSCPNIDISGKNLCQSPDRLSSLVKLARGITSKPIIVKITPNEINTAGISNLCISAGADILNISNTFTGTFLTFPDLKFVLSRPLGGYSGKPVFPISLAKVWQTRQELNSPIIASGGVEDLKSAISFLAVGANAVSIGTGIFKDYGLPKKLSLGLLTYLKKRDITIDKLIGIASIEDNRGE